MIRRGMLLVVSLAMVVVWVFPVAWGLLTSFKTERDVLAYPPEVVFEPTLVNYQDVFVGGASIVPNLVSSLVVSGFTTALTMLFAIPAAYALARLDLPWKRAGGFWVLATQMLPPVGLVIPYFLLLRQVGWTDTYQGLVLVYLTFALPFAIWLLVSYFEEIPREMEEAALLDRAGRLRTLWHVILPQAKGGIAVTIIFVFLNSWNEFLFAVVLGGNTVRPVTVAMFNFISLEQTQWARLAAAARDDVERSRLVAAAARQERQAAPVWRPGQGGDVHLAGDEGALVDAALDRVRIEPRDLLRVESARYDDAHVPEALLVEPGPDLVDQVGAGTSVEAPLTSEGERVPHCQLNEEPNGARTSVCPCPASFSCCSPVPTNENQQRFRTQATEAVSYCGAREWDASTVAPPQTFVNLSRRC